MKQYVIFFDRISRVRRTSGLSYIYRNWHNTAVVIAANAKEARTLFDKWAERLYYHPFHVKVTVDGSAKYQQYHKDMWDDAYNIDCEKPYIIMREN